MIVAFTGYLYLYFDTLSRIWVFGAIGLYVKLECCLKQLAAVRDVEIFVLIYPVTTLSQTKSANIGF